MNKEKYKISEYCRNIRNKTGLSANAFARENRVSHTYVMELEAGKRDNKVTTTTLLKIINVYKLTKIDLLKLDIDPYFLNEADSLSSLHRPVATKKESVLKRQLTNFIELVLKPKGFTAVNMRLLENNGKRNYSFKIDANMCIEPIFDAFGIDKQGKEVFIYILESTTREISNEEYALLTVKQMIDVIASYEYSNIKVNIALIFMTSSIRAYEFAKKFVAYSKKERIDIKVIYFDNRKGKK